MTAAGLPYGSDCRGDTSRGTSWLSELNACVVLVLPQEPSKLFHPTVQVLPPCLKAMPWTS